MNAGKLGITINISVPQSRDLILDLVRWADVVCESFSPHALRELGLAYGACEDATAGYAKRISYLIDEAGQVERVYASVQAGSHSAEVLADLIS